jgi:hypothetical protein
VESSQPDIILLRETMGGEALVISLLESLFKNWSFFGVDARGQYGGLAIGWNTINIKVLNS